MSGKYVRVDDVMELINTSNRGSCDYFIVDQIEELCRSEKIYDLDKVVEELRQYRNTTLSPEQVRTLQTRFVDVSIRLGEYMAIGTPEECRAAMEKQRRKLVKDMYGTSYIWKSGYCPVCGCGVTARWDYCQCCGQKLSWEDA